MTALPQHLQAFQLANEVRIERGKQRRLLRAGEITFAQALEHPAMQTMTVFALLVCQHRWGRQRALLLLRSFDRYPLSESKQVRELTDRQRSELLWAMS